MRKHVTIRDEGRLSRGMRRVDLRRDSAVHASPAGSGRNEFSVAPESAGQFPRCNNSPLGYLEDCFVARIIQTRLISDQYATSSASRARVIRGLFLKGRFEGPQIAA